MSGPTWQAVTSYLVLLALIELVVYLLTQLTSFGQSDPLASGLIALIVVWIGAGAVALASSIRSRPRWAAWGVTIVVLVVAQAVLFSVLLGRGAVATRLTEALTMIIVGMIVFASAVATGLSVGAGFATRPRTR